MIEKEDTYILSITTFHMGTDKEAALKPLEESAEVYGAWQDFEKTFTHVVSCELVSKTYLAFADEIADTIQACCNLAKRYGIDLQAAMKRCQERNRERGRYEKV